MSYPGTASTVTNTRVMRLETVMTLILIERGNIAPVIPRCAAPFSLFSLWHGRRDFVFPRRMQSFERFFPLCLWRERPAQTAPYRSCKSHFFRHCLLLAVQPLPRRLFMYCDVHKAPGHPIPHTIIRAFTVSTVMSTCPHNMTRHTSL
jgi:hypothetical protein